MDKKRAEIEAARKMIREGLAGEKDVFSRVSPVMRKQATEQFKEGLKRYEKSDEKVREKEAYDFAGYKKGGKVKKMAGGGATLPPYIPPNLINALSAQKALATPTNAPSIGPQSRLMPTPRSASPGRPMSSAAGVKVQPRAMKSGGKVSSASKRADGCATKGKTRGRMV